METDFEQLLRGNLVQTFDCLGRFLGTAHQLAVLISCMPRKIVRELLVRIVFAAPKSGAPHHALQSLCCPPSRVYSTAVHVFFDASPVLSFYIDYLCLLPSLPQTIFYPASVALPLRFLDDFRQPALLNAVMLGPW